MSELPESWAQVPLAVITSDVTQRVPSSDETIRYIDIGSVNRTTKTIETPQKLLGKDAPSRARKQVAAGDTLVSMTRPNLNAVALVPKELDGEIASTGFDVLRPVPGIDPRWINYLVRTEKFVDSMSALVQGALYPAVRSKDVRAYVVSLAPAAEQTRIANQLDTLLARIQSCNDRFEAIPALLKRFRQAVLGAATSGALTQDWRLNAKSSWRDVKLAEVAHTFSYGSAAKSSKAGTVPVLRMGNIQEGQIDWSDLVYTSDPLEIEKYKLSKGDVLFNRTNSPELVGKTAVYQGERPAIYAGYLIRVRCSSELLPEYLNYCLGSKAGRDYCWSVKSDGVSQSNINAKKLAEFSFALPPVREQAEITLDKSDYSNAIDALAALPDLNITAAFGPVFCPDGSLDRQKLGTLVFSDHAALDRLNAIVYEYLPPELLRRAQGHTLVGLDAISLMESGLGRLCACTVAVLAPAEDRVRRIMARDGISEDYARLRISAQQPDAFYRERCSHILENNCATPAQFRDQARIFFRKMLREIEHL